MCYVLENTIAHVTAPPLFIMIRTYAPSEPQVPGIDRVEYHDCSRTDLQVSCSVRTLRDLLLSDGRVSTKSKILILINVCRCLTVYLASRSMPGCKVPKRHPRYHKLVIGYLNRCRRSVFEFPLPDRRFTFAPSCMR